MSSTNTDPTLVLETGTSGFVYTIAFHPDGKHILGGNANGIGRWQLSDGEDVGKKTGMVVFAICVSRDRKWMVCGTREKGASVWDGEMEEKIIVVEGGTTVYAVDISPDSARFATGTDKEANIWNITSGQRLVGPLKFDNHVNGIRFSPNGDRIATACFRKSIHIFDSHSGDQLVSIKTNIPEWIAITPLVWSSDGQQVFSASCDQKIRAFDTSTGTQLAESQILHDRNNELHSIALAANGKFIATFAEHSISLLDTSTLARIRPVIEDGEQIWSIAISPDSSYLATGRRDGKFAIRDLGKILPESYGPFNVSTRDQVQPDEQPTTSGDRDRTVSNSTPEVPGESSRVESKQRNLKDDNSDLIELDVSSSMFAQFDYDEPSTSADHDGKVSSSTPEHPEESTRVQAKQRNKDDNSDIIELDVFSTPAQFDYGDSESLSLASSADGWEDEMPPVGSSHPISQSSDFPTVTVTSPAEAHADGNPDTVESPQRRSIFRKWLERKNTRDPTPPRPKLRRLSGKSCEPTNVNATKGLSWMAASQPKTRSAARGGRRNAKSAAEAAFPKDPNEDTSRSAQESATANETGRHNPSQPAGRVHIMRGPGDAFIAFRIPSWMVCGSSGTEGGRHA